MTRICEEEALNNDDAQNMQLVPINESSSCATHNKLVPKVCQLVTVALFTPFYFSNSYMCCSNIFQAVEKVLAGAIRREMALEEFCAKQTSEITHLNRLVHLSSNLGYTLFELQLKLIQFLFPNMFTGPTIQT